MEQVHGIQRAQTHGEFMKKLNAKVKTSVWVDKVQKGALAILAGGRVTSEEDQEIYSNA